MWGSPRIALVVLVGLLGCGGLEDEIGLETEESAATALTFTAIADTRVDGAFPNTNFGSGDLVADGSPARHSYLRFSVTGASTAVQSAKMRCYVTDSSVDGPALYRTGGGWTESGITWNNRPAPTGGALADKGAVSASAWVEFDVTSAVTGNGTYDFVLVPNSTDSIHCNSREAASNRPQLVVTVADPSTSTPGPTPAPVPSYRVTVSQGAGVVTAKDSSGQTISSGTNAATVIQAAVDAVKSKGGGTVHLNSGTYPIGVAIDFGRANNFVFEGSCRDSTILRATAATNILRGGGSSTAPITNVTVRNINLDGANIGTRVINVTWVKGFLLEHCILERHNANDGPGVYLSRLRDAVVRNCIARNPMGHGDALAIGGWNIKVLYNEVIRQATSGGGLTSGGIHGGEFAYNYIHDANTYGGISLENQSSGYSNMHVHDNRLERIHDGNAILALNYSSSGQGHDGLYIYNNTITDVTSGSGIKLGAFTFSDSSRTNKVFSNGRIYGNKITNTKSNAINAGPLKNYSIDNNTITTAGSYGIRLFSNLAQDGVITDGVTMNRNSITSATSGKYYYSGSTNIWIDGVKVQ